jgi:hypothetical protein
MRPTEQTLNAEKEKTVSRLDTLTLILNMNHLPEHPLKHPIDKKSSVIVLTQSGQPRIGPCCQATREKK